MTIGEFAGLGRGRDSLNLSTLHSAKGREFDVVILFAMNEGVVPRSNATDRDIVVSRRLFYVGFTRARHEVHLMYSQAVPSRFRSEEHTSELQSLMRISYAVFCLKKKRTTNT